MKITFVGAGSTIFVKNILGDVLLHASMSDCEIALYDIDRMRLQDSQLVVETLNRTINGGRAAVTSYLGTDQRKQALMGATFVVNAIQVGGYDPATKIDFEIPARYGLRQSIGDTLGIGGIFRGLRTAVVMHEILDEMEHVCPEALLLNYANPMAIIIGYMQRVSSIRTIGLCHSVQVCASHLLQSLDMSADHLHWEIAGINHMAWLLKITDGKKDLYPEIRERALLKNAQALIDPSLEHDDMVRFEMMRRIGYYTTESSEHNAEYTPYWIKRQYPGLIDQYRIPLDEYPRRCVEQIAQWTLQREKLIGDASIEHEKTIEYGADIMNAFLTDTPAVIHGNTLNSGYITNLPEEAVVEVPCTIDASGIHPHRVGALPIACAALNSTNIQPQLLTIEAALTGKKEHVYQAAMLDPHTAAELSIDDIVALCDDLLEAHAQWLPAYR